MKEINIAFLDDEGDWISRQGSDGTVIQINNRTFHKLSPPKQEFVLSHEVIHAFWLQIVRSRKCQSTLTE